MFFVDGRGRAFTLTLLAVVLATTACASGGPIGTPVSAPEPAPPPALEKQPAPPTTPRTRPAAPRTAPATPRTAPAAPTPRRAPGTVLDSTAMELAVMRQHDNGPLTLALARRTGNPDMAYRAASALVREAERLKLSPSLLAAVLLIENAPLDSVAVSTQGAIGMMQIMPVHLGSFGCEADLVNVESNICHGARLLKHLVRRTGSVAVALRRYNGCVVGRHTPRCNRYPARVLRTASRLRREVLVTAVDSTRLYRETLAAQARGSLVSVPSQPVASPDTADTSAGSPQPHCATLVGCLRYRWSLTY